MRQWKPRASERSSLAQAQDANDQDLDQDKVVMALVVFGFRPHVDS